MLVDSLWWGHWVKVIKSIVLPFETGWTNTKKGSKDSVGSNICSSVATYLLTQRSRTWKRRAFRAESSSAFSHTSSLRLAPGKILTKGKMVGGGGTPIFKCLCIRSWNTVAPFIHYFHIYFTGEITFLTYRQRNNKRHKIKKNPQRLKIPCKQTRQKFQVEVIAQILAFPQKPGQGIFLCS